SRTDLPGRPAAAPDELEERTGVVVPDEGPYETLAGLVMTELGRVPQLGDSVVVAGAHLTVTQMQGRRVTQVTVTPPPPHHEEEVSL
uniref:transporter associated domain-containing protein n=1 Tax=Actinomyces polynesiensis TaxID=1325934 RepID=UPI0005BE7965